MSWMAGRLPSRPQPGQITDVIAAVGVDTRILIGATTRDYTRITTKPWGGELALALPGYAGKALTPNQAWAVRLRLEAVLGSDPAGWEVAVGLAATGWDGSLEGLAETAAATVAL